MSVYKRKGIWYVEFIQDGVRVKRSAGRTATRAQAHKLERSLRTALEQASPGPGHTFDEALERWLNGEAKGLRDRGLSSHIRRVLDHVAGARLADGLEVAERLRAACHAEGLAPATTNRRLAVVKRCLSLAFKWGWIEEDLCRRITLERVRNERTVALTAAQVESLAAACPMAEAGRAVRAAAFSGLRRGELLALREDSLRSQDGSHWLHLPTSKTGHERQVPVPASKLELYTPLPFNITDVQLRRQWEKARRATGLTHVRFHDLRHTYGTWLSGAGVNEFAIAALMGHRDRRTTHRYVKRPAEHLLAAVRRLEPAAPEPPESGGESPGCDS